MALVRNQSLSFFGGGHIGLQCFMVTLQFDAIWMINEFPNEFNSQLSLEGITFRIKVEQVDWSPENLNVVESFHRCIICTEHETPDLWRALVCRRSCAVSKGLQQVFQVPRV